MFDFKLTNHKMLESYWAQLMMYNLMLTGDKTPTAYVCSPLRADTQHGVEMNMSAVRAYMCYAFVKLGINAQAPHAFLPYFLDDNNPTERQLALDVGLAMLRKCSILLVCGNRISMGMRGEIREAAKLGKEIRVYSRDILDEVIAIVKESGLTHGSVTIDEEHSYLSLSAEAIIPTDMKGADDVM